jgi:hypothetical protein
MAAFLAAFGVLAALGASCGIFAAFAGAGGGGGWFAATLVFVFVAAAAR